VCVCVCVCVLEENAVSCITSFSLSKHLATGVRMSILTLVASVPLFARHYLPKSCPAFFFLANCFHSFEAKSPISIFTATNGTLFDPFQPCITYRMWLDEPASTGFKIPSTRSFSHFFVFTAWNEDLAHQSNTRRSLILPEYEPLPNSHPPCT
jgi:hypothetical protein